MNYVIKSINDLEGNIKDVEQLLKQWREEYGEKTYFEIMMDFDDDIYVLLCSSKNNIVTHGASKEEIELRKKQKEKMQFELYQKLKEKYDG